jgi:peptide/nickel transport system permease protein
VLTSPRWRGPAEYLRLAVRLVLSLLAVSVLVFLLTIAVPGDPARAALGKAATPAQLKAFDAAHGLDAPLYEQFGRFLQHLVQGQLGTSYASGQSVATAIGARFERTFFLVLIAWLIAALISIPVGMWSGRRAGSAADSVLSGATLALAALPEFVIGLLLVFIVGVKLGWLPVNSTAAGYSTTPWGDFSSYLLPAIAIALTIIPYITRLTRANAREVDSEPYIRAAILRGVHGPRLTFMHVLPNAAPPVLNALALQFAGSIGGVVVTETVFGFPGIGQLLVQAVGSRDLPVVQAITIIIGAVYVLVNTLADAGVRALTPRLRPTQQVAPT